MTSDPELPSDSMDWDAIARFMAGESPDAEIESVSQWMAEHPDEAAAITAMHAASLGVAAKGAPPLDVSAAWQGVSARLDEAPGTRRQLGVIKGTRPAFGASAPEPRPSRWSLPALGAAAAIAVVTAGALIWQSTNDSGKTAVAAAADFATAPAQRDSVVLTDGTGVLLGPGSSLRVEAGYGDGRRTVRLEGEALFDVRHDDARPFVVHTSDLVIHDLGTTFTVRTTKGSGGITNVAVTVGAVRIARSAEGADSGVVLRQGDMARVGAGPIIVQRGVPLDDALAFTQGRLVFRDTPLLAVASALERWYGVTVQVDPRLSARTLTSSFQGESLAEVLEVIRLALDAPVQQTNGVVMIGPRATP